VLPVLLDEEGREIHGPGEGYLVFKKPWPGMMRTLYGNHARFQETYFAKFPGYYCTGDGQFAMTNLNELKLGYYYLPHSYPFNNELITPSQYTLFITY
jgi:hypothetical protein